MNKLFNTIWSSLVAILSKIAKFIMSIPSWLVSFFKTIGSFFMMCLLWVKRLLLSGWSLTKSLFAKARSIRKPSWFQWNIFPKDGQPPTQSLFEIVFYALFLGLFVLLFSSINRIPQYEMAIEMDKLNNCRYVTKDLDSDTVFYLHYNLADINLKIPMHNMKNGVTIDTLCTYKITFDSLRIGCYNYGHDIELKTKLNAYWHAIFVKAAQWSCLPITKSHGFANSEFEKDFDFVYSSFRREKELDKSLDFVKTNFIDTLNDTPKNYYLFRTTFIFDKSINASLPDTTWHKDTINDFLNIRKATINDNQISKSLIADRYYVLFGDTKREQNKPYYNSYYRRGDGVITAPVEIKGSIEGFRTNSRLRKILPNERPGWLDLNDVSQANYRLHIKTKSIDSVTIIIDFIGATEFYPSNVLPDEIGGSYIKYTDPLKILRIKKEGLSFYAKFKELENIQTIRNFGLTAIISGIVIIILTFFIIGLYRSIKVIKNFKSKKS